MCVTLPVHTRAQAVGHCHRHHHHLRGCVPAGGGGGRNVPTPSSLPPIAGTGANSGVLLGVAAGSSNIGTSGQLTLLPNGDLVIPAVARCVIVAVDAGTQITYALAGNGTCLTAGVPAASDVLATSTGIGFPRIAVPWQGGVLFSTQGDQRVRFANLTSGLVSTWVNSAGTAAYGGDGGPALSATLHNVEGMALWGGGLVICDRGANRLRLLDLSTRIITTIGGDGTLASSGNGGLLVNAQFAGPSAVLALPDGSLLVGQYDAYMVRRVTATSIVQAFMGTGVSSSTGDGGLATAATLTGPVGLAAVDVNGVTVVAIADFNGHRVRRVRWTSACESGLVSPTSSPTPTRSST
jgi:trimeric autotransporter adhesin